MSLGGDRQAAQRCECGLPPAEEPMWSYCQCCRAQFMERAMRAYLADRGQQRRALADVLRRRVEEAPHTPPSITK